MKLSTPTVLVMCEGFGYSTEIHNNAIAQAETPFLNELCQQYPTTLIKSHGSALGYPDYYGSSLYAGFWTLLSGQTNNTLLAQLETDIHSGDFFEHKILQKMLTQVSKNNKRFHIIITLSNTTQEHRIEHMLALIHTALFHGIKEIMIHLVLSDNNNFDMNTFLLLEKIESAISTTCQVHLATIQGKQYTISSDDNFIKESYKTLTQPTHSFFLSPKDFISQCYVQGIHDNNLPPTSFTSTSFIQPKDGVLFATYNKAECAALQNYMIKRNTPVQTTLSLFPSEVEGITSLYHQRPYKNNFSTLLKNRSLSALAITDYTYKNNLCFYAQNVFKDFYQAITMRSIPPVKSPTGNTATTLTDAFIEALTFENHDLYIINYTTAALHALHNNFSGAIAAVEEIDEQLARIYYEVIKKRGGKLFITSSAPLIENIDKAGNALPFSNNSNPVYFIAADPSYTHPLVDLPVQELSQVGSFIIKNM